MTSSREEESGEVGLRKPPGESDPGRRSLVALSTGTR